MAFEDDVWAHNRLHEWAANPRSQHESIGEGSFRYADVDGVVHRAWWANGQWQSLCGLKNPTQTLQERDPGAVTCVGCVGNGA